MRKRKKINVNWKEFKQGMLVGIPISFFIILFF